MRIFVTLAVMLTVITGSGYAEVLASVDGSSLSWEDLVEMVGGEQNVDYLGITSIAAAQEVLQSWIREELIYRAAIDSDLESNPHVSSAIEQAKRQILLEAYLADIMSDIEVSRLDAENYVDAWESSYLIEINTRHILVDDPNLANSILARLRSGADFGELAEQYSICPSSADGGNLGWMTRGQAVIPFMEAACQLQPGQISDVVETNMGYHIIELIDTRNITPAPDESQILELAGMELSAALQEEAILDVLDELESTHRISIYPERLMNHF